VSETRVHDVRFTRFDGELEGERAAILSLARWSALRSLGARRSWKVKLIPIALTLMAFAPAIVVLGLRALFGATVDIDIESALPYRDYAGQIGLVIALFAAVTTPELLCPDRRHRVLTLYFATALTRAQYVVGKILAAIVPLLLVTLLPMWFLYAGNVLFAIHPVGYVEDHLADLGRITVSGFVLAVWFGLAGLAIASLTGRRAFAVGGYLAFTSVPTAVGFALADALDEPNLEMLAFPVAPALVVEALYPSFDGSDVDPSSWVLNYAIVAIACLGVVVWRYRTASA
jgi:ABC-2 type transport system permease protein